jgi:hypothetical protein
MTGSLKVQITHALRLVELRERSSTRVGQMLNVGQEFMVATQAPETSSIDEPSPMIPNRPYWGALFYLEGVNESLVEAVLSTLSATSGEQPVLCFRELRTSASKVLAAGLAVAAAELLGAAILDHEHVWADKDEVSPHDFLGQLAAPERQPNIESALSEFIKRMNRPE